MAFSVLPEDPFPEGEHVEAALAGDLETVVVLVLVSVKWT